MMKMFEETIESQLEDSSGKYETAAEMNIRDRRSDSFREVICDVAPMR